MEQKPERAIYFKDLFFAALYRWKWMVLAAVICGVVLGSMQVLFPGETETMNTTAITSETQLKIDHHRQTLELAEAGIAAQEDYLKNSRLMALDAYSAYTAGFHLYPCPASLQNVEEGTVPYDNTPRILRSYAVFVTAADTVQALADEFGMEVKYMAELVRASITGTESVTVTVRGADPEEAEKLAQAVRRLVEAQKGTVDSTVEPHELTVIDFATGPRVDSDLQTAQNEAQQKLLNLKSSRVTSTVELEKLLPSELMTGGPNPLLFGIVGAVLGVLLVAVVAFVGHIGSGKVYSAKALKAYTGLTLLGCVCSDKKRGPVERLLRRLEGRADYGKTDVAALNIAGRCEGRKLLLMGSYAGETVKSLTDKLTEKGITCILCGKPGESAEALEQLPLCDGVVLVETCGLSRYDDILWAKETAQAQGKALVGCVLIDG